MTYEECMSFIMRKDWTGSKPGLSRTRTLLKALHNPHKKLKYVHVVGTNGKGSTCEMLAKTLTKAGYKTGKFTSPNVTCFNERIEIDGKFISDEALVRLMEKIAPIAESMEDSPTEFEIITAIGLQYFVDEGCDIVVLEAGMGGLLDSTNVIPAPLVAVFTSIGLDHMQYLGNTVEEIAKTKAGILKKGTGDAVFFGEEEPAVPVLSKLTAKKNIKLHVPDRNLLEIKEISAEGSLFTYKNYVDLRVGMVGYHQILNAITVIEIVECLRNDGFEIDDEAIRHGLSVSRLPARFEVLSQKPLIIYDGSHNVNGITKLVQNVDLFLKGKNITVIMGVMADKAHETILDMIAPFTKHLYSVTPSNVRSLPAEKLAQEAKAHGIMAAAPINLSEEGVGDVVKSIGANDVLLVMGSLYLYADIVRFLKPWYNSKVENQSGRGKSAMTKEKNETRHITVAIDGPAGAGKSTIAKMVSSELNLIYLDTGAMYRSFALYCKNEGLGELLAREGTDDETRAAIIALTESFDLEIRYIDGVQHMILAGEDINGLIRTPEMSAFASKVSAIPEVRVMLVKKQQEIAKKESIVMDGRDIGTHVLPDATVKIFLTASPEARAKRRYLELLEKGPADYETVYKDMVQRDHNDMTRSASPLVKAEDAVLLDTSDMTREESVESVLKIVRASL